MRFLGLVRGRRERGLEGKYGSKLDMGSTLDEIVGLISKPWNNCNKIFLTLFPRFQISRKIVMVDTLVRNHLFGMRGSRMAIQVRFVGSSFGGAGHSSRLRN